MLLHTLVPDPEQRWGIDEVAEYLEDVGYSSGFVVPEQELRPFPKSIPRDVQVVNIQQPRLGSPDLKPRPGSPQGLEVVEEGQDGALAAEKFAYISAASVNENPCVYFVAEYLGSSSAVKVLPPFPRPPFLRCPNRFCAVPMTVFVLVPRPLPLPPSTNAAPWDAPPPPCLRDS